MTQELLNETLLNLTFRIFIVNTQVISLLAKTGQAQQALNMKTCVQFHVHLQLK